MTVGRRVAFSLTFAAWVVSTGCREEPEETPPLPKAKPVAELIKAEGPVSLQRAGAVDPTAKPGSLFIGDVVVTGEASSAVVRFSDGQELEVGHNTRFRIGEKLDQVNVEIEQGEILARANTAAIGAPVKVAIRTPEGTVAIQRGSEASFSVSHERSAIDVRLGQVTMVDKEGVERKAGAGDALELRLGKIELVAKEKPEGEWASAPATAMTMAADRGTAILMPPGEKLKKVAKKPVNVPGGSSFFVPRFGRAWLTGNGVRALLYEGAKGTVGKAARLKDVDRYAIGLRAGSMRLFFAEGGKREVVLDTGGKQTHLSSGSATTAVASYLNGREHLSIVAGTLDIVGKGATQTAKACSIADVDDAGAVQVSPCPRPALVLPAGRRVRVVANRLRDVGLAFAEPGVEGVEVEVASDSGYTDRVLAGKVYGAFTLAEPPARGELFWRVKSAAENASVSSQARFEPDESRGGDAENPHAEVTDTGLKATVYYQSKLPAVTFVYPTTEGAEKYRLRVYRTQDLKSPIVDSPATDTRFTVAAGKLDEGTYVWYASPLDEAGTELAGGRMNKLELVYDNSWTTLAIARPRVGEKPGPDGVRAEGIAPLGAKLFVNGKPAPLDDKGRFALMLPRTEVVIFRMLAENGGESYWVRALKAGR